LGFLKKEFILSTKGKDCGGLDLSLFIFIQFNDGYKPGAC
jgi:hypothetical protein